MVLILGMISYIHMYDYVWPIILNLYICFDFSFKKECFFLCNDCWIMCHQISTEFQLPHRLIFSRTVCPPFGPSSLPNALLVSSVIMSIPPCFCPSFLSSFSFHLSQNYLCLYVYALILHLHFIVISLTTVSHPEPLRIGWHACFIYYAWVHS